MHTYAMNVLKESPFNAEPDLKTLVAHELTPIELVYSRNHSDIQNINAETFTVKINGAVNKPLELSLADLKSKFPSKIVVAAMQVRHTVSHHFEMMS